MHGSHQSLCHKEPAQGTQSPLLGAFLVFTSDLELSSLVMRGLTEKVLCRYAPGFQASIVGKEVLPPPDLEAVFGLTGGNIFHGAMSLDQLYLTRPTGHIARLGSHWSLLLHYCALIGRELQRNEISYAIMNQLASLLLVLFGIRVASIQGKYLL